MGNPRKGANPFARSESTFRAAPAAHQEQEEIYAVVLRGYEAGPDGLEILDFGAPSLGENPRDDVHRQRDWWAD